MSQNRKTYKRTLEEAADLQTYEGLNLNSEIWGFGK
jgi:hypothetical protein